MASDDNYGLRVHALVVKEMKARKMKVKHLAEIADVDVGHASRFMRGVSYNKKSGSGRVKNPSFNVLVKICLYLDLSLDELIAKV